MVEQTIGLSLNLYRKWCSAPCKTAFRLFSTMDRIENRRKTICFKMNTNQIVFASQICAVNTEIGTQREVQKQRLTKRKCHKVHLSSILYDYSLSKAQRVLADLESRKVSKNRNDICMANHVSDRADLSAVLSNQYLKVKRVANFT